jgi:hypothetical protein
MNGQQTLMTFLSHVAVKPEVKRLTTAKSKEKITFRATPRDRQIVKAVYEYRALTTHQIAELIFYANTQASRLTGARRRLKPLSENGYLYRGEIPTKQSEGSNPFVYWIDKNSRDWLAELLEVAPSEIVIQPQERQMKEQGLNHLLRTNDVRVALNVAALKNDYEIVEWLDDYHLKKAHADLKISIKSKRGNVSQVSLVPDGYFKLGRDFNGMKDAHFFIEADLGTETVENTWKKKIQTYIGFYKTGLFSSRYGAKYPRVLTVTTSQQRLENIKKATEEIGGKKMFHFTTFENLSPETALTAPIWHVATAKELTSLV